MASALQPEQPIPQSLQLYNQQEENLRRRPFSPWAARFGITDTQRDAVFDRASEQKSGVAPDHSTTNHLCLISPFIHSIYYGDPLKTEDQGVFSTQDDIDRFFFAETKYRTRFACIAPWQLGPQNRSVRFSRRGYVPGGNIKSLVQPTIHAAIFDTERIQVDEDKWFRFFRKDRWWGSVAPPEDQGEYLDGDRWSVDEPRAWYWISVAIELADRMLKALIKDKHPFLETMLYGKLTYWNDPEYIQNAPSAEPQPEAKVLLSRAFMKQQWQAENGNAPFNWDMVLDKFDDHDWTARMEDLSSGQQWAFQPPTNDDNDNYAGITDTTQGGLISLNSIRLRSLMSSQYTLAELCNIIYCQANTVTHALVHMRVRHDRNPFFTNLKPYNDMWWTFPNLNSEPTMAGRRKWGTPGLLTVIVLTVETAIFGGSVRLIASKGEQEAMLGINKISWPYPYCSTSGPYGRMASGHPAFQDGADNTLTLIPSLWTSKLVSEEFWKDDTIPRKSDNFFHSIDFFRSEHPYEAATFDTDKRPIPIIMDREKIRELHQQGQLDAGIVDMISDWEKRESLFNQARAGWYEEKRERWSYLEARRRFYVFDAEMKKASWNRRLYHCANNAHWLMSVIPWGSRDQYTTYLHEREKMWPWHAVGTIDFDLSFINHLCIGLLMMAAIPFRLTEVRIQPPLKPIHVTLYPSSENPTSMPVWKYIRGATGANINYKEWTPASVFHDPLDRDGQVFFYGQYTHIDYLDLVKKLIKYFASMETLVSKPWIDEILRVEARIREQREQQRRAMTPVAMGLSYADTAWDFKIPEYDPNQKWWSSNADRWVDL
ncbi:hypothetical protein RRF57_010114 [Xylaria bambusicola]|uniref:Uncharacterized protein n=1 Tax=Xylaria bambusicola TaxID=326684 RepID=A0AAN7ZCG3_9PEZI